MKANGYYNHPRVPLEAGCGLIEEDSIAFTSVSGKTAETPSFPLEIFPKAIRDIIEALEEYENYNVDFTAASFLTVFAAAMGNTWSVRFMTGWVSRPIIYMVLVGSPSCGKTPPLQQAVAPLLKLDGEYDVLYCKEMETFRRWERMSAKQRERYSLPEEMKMPQRKCHVVVDSTVEALIGALRDNPRGVLIYKDEIDSLDRTVRTRATFSVCSAARLSSTAESQATSISSSPIPTVRLSALRSPGVWANSSAASE